MSNEEKWREDFEHFTFKFIKSTHTLSGWDCYLAARKTAQLEIHELQETIRSCNERNRLLVEAGWKNVMGIEERDQEIKRLRNEIDLLLTAR